MNGFNFFIANKHLKRVYIEDDYENEKHFDLNSLLLQLPSIEKMTIMSNEKIHFDIIVKFIENHHTLQWLVYGTKKFSDFDGDLLKKELSHNWKTSEIHDQYSGLLFEREHLVASIEA